MNHRRNNKINFNAGGQVCCVCQKKALTLHAVSISLYNIPTLWALYALISDMIYQKHRIE